METKFDSVLDIQGNAVAGAGVRILNESRQLAEITPNPTSTDKTGEFSFTGPNGQYFIEISVGGVVREIRGPVILFDPKDDRVSVKDFGAVGDGVIDDTLAIQNAMNNAAGRALYFPAGTYFVSAAKAAAAITIPQSGVRMYGAGKYASIIKTATDCVSVAGVDCEKVEIEHLGFDGSQSAGLAWQRGVLLRGVVRASVSNCHFKNIGGGPLGFSKIGFGGSDAVANGTRQCETLHVVNNVVENCYGSVAIITKFFGVKEAVITGNILKNAGPCGISVESEQSGSADYGENLVVSHNIIKGTIFISAGTGAIGISISECMRRVTCIGNVIDTVTGDFVATGITIDSSPEQSDTSTYTVVVSGNAITNVTAVNGRGAAIGIYTGNVDLHGLTVSGNTIKDSEVGILLSTASGSKTLGTIYGASISGNVIENASENGIWTANVGGAGELSVKWSSVSGNVIVGTASLNGISMRIEQSDIVGNVVQGAAGDGIQLQVGSADVLIASNTTRLCGGNGFNGSGDRVTYNGNVAMSNGQSGTESYGIRHASGANVIVINNRCGDTQATPTQDYGVRATAGSTVRGNELIGNSGGTVWGGIAAHNTGTYDAGLNRTA